MTPYPADFGGYVIGALPYAGAEALRIAAWCIAFVAPVAAACWLLGRARRLARPSTPGIRHLHRAAANADDRHAPVTRELPLGDLVVSREVERYAAHKANAPTEAITRTRRSAAPAAREPTSAIPARALSRAATASARPSTPLTGAPGA